MLTDKVLTTLFDENGVRIETRDSLPGNVDR